MDREKDRESRDRDAEEDSAPVSKSDLVRAKLKLIGHYAMLAFAPVVAVIALVAAVIAVADNRSQADRAQLGVLISKIDSLNASLADTKGELENLKFAMSREKTARGEERKKADERDAKVIQNLSRLQTKLKVSPTIEDQLREVASAPAATPVAISATSAPAATPAPVVTEKKPATPVPAPKAANKTSDAKTPAQAKALKEAIEKFNKK